MNEKNFLKNIKKLINNGKYIDKTVNHRKLDNLGFFVVKDAFPLDTIKKYRSKFLKFLEKKN